MKNNKKETLKENFAEAFKNYKKRDLKTAEILCYKILSIEPNHFDSTFLLATIFALDNNFDKAKKLLYKALEIQPKNVNVLNNLGTAYKALGNDKEAINYYSKVLQIDLNHVNAHYNLGIIYHKLKELEKAKNYFQKTVEIQNNYALAFFGLANVYVDLKNFEKAVSCYQKTIELNPKIIGAYNNLGLVFRILNDFKNAIHYYNQGLEIKADHAGVHHNLALAYKEIGDFKKAIKSHELAIKSEPDNIMHYFYLSAFKKDILNDTLKNKIQKIIGKVNCKKIDIAFGNYLLAKYARKNKDYSRELDYLKKGHQSFFDSKKEKFKLGIKYCFDDVLQISEGAKITNFNNKDDYNLKPIFIIGVPRCGSTLVEKIIGSGGELIPMGEETGVLENLLNQKILEKQSLNLEAKEMRKEMYDIYKQKGLVSKKYDYTFTDKSLNNFFYLDIIKSLYPNAKIINCKRKTFSSIMSIFQNNLVELAWAHDLENIFKYFNNYFKIIENFNETNPDFIYGLEYEKLVLDPENESKKLLKFCGLPWDKKCLEFYKRKDLFSKTESNIQIRKEIYKDSSDKYTPYKKLLDEYGKNYTWYN